MGDDRNQVRVAMVEADDRAVPLRVAEAHGDADSVAVVLPAMGVPARWYDGLAHALASSGRPTVVVEFPGQGDSPVAVTRDTAIGYQELLASEVAAGMAFVAERWPGAPRVLVGHSLGGQLSLLYAASHPGEVAAIALLAAGTIHWRAFDGVAGPGILAVTQVARMIAAVRGLFPGDRLGFGGRQPRRLISDWGRVGLTGRWEPANASADYHALLARLSVPILSVTMVGDSFAPSSASAALVGMVPLADVRHVTVASPRPGRHAHFAWLRDPDDVVAEMAVWFR